MDFLVELLIQLVVQFVVEVIGDLLFESVARGLGEMLVRPIGRCIIGGLVGFGFGTAWGHRLSGGSSWPKLLWVSLILGFVAIALAAGRSSAVADVGDRVRSRSPNFWIELLAPPWRWPASRLVAFAILNAAIAGGIAVSFHPASVT
ncbi:MAG: hypothetical protein JWO88_2158 [Frankiales bacterium]|nr:hypothetical protein [Frankiales bacterium]